MWKKCYDMYINIYSNDIEWSCSGLSLCRKGWAGVDVTAVVCDCGTEKPVSILGFYCKAFTPAWLGGRPPPSEPPKSAGF